MEFGPTFAICLQLEMKVKLLICYLRSNSESRLHPSNSLNYLFFALGRICRIRMRNPLFISAEKCRLLQQKKDSADKR